MAETRGVKTEPQQLGLFGAAGVGAATVSRKPADPKFLQRLESEHAEAAAIAKRLPSGVFFGTSTWSFPGWAGIVYSRRATAAELAREGLAEYARHPLLTTVGIDRGYYGPIPAEDLRRYASQLPPLFPCCAKAPEAVTSAASPDYLDPQRFVDEMVGPFLDAFRDHTGPFLLQLPPAPRGVTPEPSRFAGRLDRFLRDLPTGARYAVELREPSLLTPAYRDVLRARGAAHVYNYATAMPMPEEQALRVPLETASFVVIRLLLRPGTRYEERREEFVPFDRIVDPSPEMRREVVSLLRQAVGLGRDVFVLVNNKAEGCSPLTIRALAEALAEEREGHG